jgi:MraZ protein
MLDGSFTVKVDDKGRIKLPAEFRKRIEEKFGSGSFYVTSVRGECARIYPERAWSEVRQKLASQPPSKPAVRKFVRATGYYGQMATMDPQGRVLIHPRLRTDAGLASEVVIIGHQNHLEVWNHKRFRGILESEPFTDQDEDYISTLEV